MELEVLNPRGLPKKAVISISVGGTRRQVPLAGLDRPLRFPGKAEDVSQIKVDVLNVMGSCRLPYEPSVEKYTVPIESVSGETLENKALDSMELDLIVRCCDPEIALTPSKEEADASRKKKEVGASDYLEEHGLVGFMQFLLTTLMQDKPADPYHFLHKQIARRIAAKAGASGESDQADVYALLDRLSPKSAAKLYATQDVEGLEREAVQAAHQLRAENASMRQTALELKTEYEKLMQESGSLQNKLDAKRAVSAASTRPGVLPFNRYYNRFLGRQCPRNQWHSIHLRFDSYRPPTLSAAELEQEAARNSAASEIQALQDDVGALARENAKLVADLARGREMIETVRNDILDIRRSVLDE